MVIENANSRKINNNKGFTLVELIVVLVILAILAAILVPALLGYIDRSKAANCAINKNSLVKAAISLYVMDYGKSKTVTDDASFDKYLSTRINTLYEDAKPTSGTLQFENVCNQGGVVTLHVSSYTNRPFEITATCSVHDDGEEAGSSSSPSKTPEQTLTAKMLSLWSEGLPHGGDGPKSSNGFTLGKAIVSNKGDDTRELIKQLGVDVDNNIVSIKNTTDIKISKDGTNYYPISQAMSDELNKNVSPSYTKIINISADDQGSTVKKGDERIVTQYLFYEGKDNKNQQTQILYGTRTVKLTYTANNNLGMYTVSDLDGNPIDDKEGLVGWTKVN